MVVVVVAMAAATTPAVTAVAKVGTVEGTNRAVVSQHLHYRVEYVC